MEEEEIKKEFSVRLEVSSIAHKTALAQQVSSNKVRTEMLWR
jgi:hypothetical protein